MTTNISPQLIGIESLQSLSRLAIASLRNGYSLSESESTALDTLPAIDALRKVTQPRDIEWLLPIVQGAPEATAGFACSLLRYHIEECGVAETMMERWDAASPHLKNRMMWRLLEYRGLERAWHERFLQFTLEKWDVFNDFNRQFYGPPDPGLQIALKRLDESPEMKKWIYWLSLPSVAEGAQLAELLSRGLASGDEFSAKAIREYQAKFKCG